MVVRDLYAELRASATEGEMMKEVWNMLTATLGVPPSPDEKIKWEYVDARGTAKVWQGTPKQFYKQFTSKVYPVGL